MKLSKKTQKFKPSVFAKQREASSDDSSNHSEYSKLSSHINHNNYGAEAHQIQANLKIKNTISG